MTNYFTNWQRQVISPLVMLCLLTYAHLSCENEPSAPGPMPIPPDLLSWSIQATEILSDLTDIQFQNSSFGWAVGKQVVLATATGGADWPIAPLDSTRLPDLINSVCFINEEQGWFTTGIEEEEGGEIFISEQGGAYPVLQESFTGAMNSIFFIDNMNGWSAGVTGEVAYTNDGGKEWQMLADLQAEIIDIHFTTMNKGWAVGENGTVHHTTDGVNFQIQDLGTDARINAVHFTDTLYGWVSGDLNTIYRRHMDDNNQIVWSETRIPGLADLVDWNDIYFVNRLNGWVVGTEGRIYKTTDGGINWTRELAPTVENLNAIYMISSVGGWIAGDNGTILTYGP